MGVPLDHQYRVLSLATTGALRTDKATGRVSVDWAKADPVIQANNQKTGVTYLPYVAQAAAQLLRDSHLQPQYATGLLRPTRTGKKAYERMRPNYATRAVVYHYVVFRGSSDEVVGMEFRGGDDHRVAKTWPWNETGCKAAEKWALDHNAVMQTSPNTTVTIRAGDIVRKARQPQQARFKRVRDSLTSPAQALLDEVMNVSAATGADPGFLLQNANTRHPKLGARDVDAVRRALTVLGVKVSR